MFSLLGTTLGQTEEQSGEGRRALYLSSLKMLPLAPAGPSLHSLKPSPLSQPYLEAEAEQRAVSSPTGLF